MAFREDGVVAVFAVRGKTFLTAFEQADNMFVAEIPAAVALAQVAAERAHVADLRPADLASGHGQRGIRPPQVLVRGDIGQLDSAADLEAAAIGDPSSPEDLDEVATDAADADDLAGLRDVFLLQVEQVGPARQQL